jgi:hypothetical protein
LFLAEALRATVLSAAPWFPVVSVVKSTLAGRRVFHRESGPFAPWMLENGAPTDW